MGNDGGSIPKRRELVKNASRAPTVSELKATVLESQSHAWTHCALNGEPLDLDAVVSDGYGRLYNYEAILDGLVPSDDRTETPRPSAIGITSIRDVVHLKFSKQDKTWICPISMKEMGVATRAVYLVPCGHVFAEVAIVEIQEESCPECGAAFDQENVIPILPTSEKDTSRLERRIDGLRGKGLAHSLKKDKSEKKRKGRTVEESNEARGDDKKDEALAKTGHKRTRETLNQRTSSINNTMTVSLTAKVLAEQDDKNKRHKRVADTAGRNPER